MCKRILKKIKIVYQSFLWIIRNMAQMSRKGDTPWVIRIISFKLIVIGIGLTYKVIACLPWEDVCRTNPEI